jgi:hypothetical protein
MMEQLGRHILAAALLVQGCQVAMAAQHGANHAVAVFAGVATDTVFTDSMFFPWTNDLENIGVVGIAYSQRFGTLDSLTNSQLPLGEHLMIEGELGLSGRFGDESLGEAWTGLYLRYDGFPWNEKIYTTLAVNTGLSLLTTESDFERGRDENHKNATLLHYMGPEITFADPANKNLELLVRFHHRSGVFGLFDGVVSGSTFISSGVRVRF